MPIRLARPSDVEPILKILIEVACEVPIKLGTSEQLQNMREQIKNCYLNRFSVVAVDNDGVVVGFQLAKEKIAANELRYIHLAYTGVTASARGGAFRQLIEAEKQHGLPLFAEVKPDNESRMAEILIHCGFHRYHLDPEENILADFRWDPS